MDLQNLDQKNISKILYDHVSLDKKIGTHSGAIITKLKPVTESIIFSENVKITETSLEISGLEVGVKEKKAFSNEKKEMSLNINKIDYCIKLSPQLTQKFDHARFSASFPNIVRFLHTACVYFETDDAMVNHLDFVINEILNRPVAISHQNGIIVADRLVVDEKLNLIFYDAITIYRDHNRDLNIMYEDFVTIPRDAICYLVILGTENF